MGTTMDLSNNDCGNKPPERLEMLALISRVHHLGVLISPLARACSICDKIRRWESSMVCLLILICCNGSCLLLPPGYTLVLTLTLVGLAGSLGVAHRQTRILCKVLPPGDHSQGGYEDGTAATDAPTNHAELVEQYKAMLFQIDDIVTRCCKVLTFMYSVIKWETVQISIRFYLLLMSTVIFLHVLPLRWSVVMVINMVLLENPFASFLVGSPVFKGMLTKIFHQEGKEICVEMSETSPPPTTTLSAASSETDLSAEKESLAQSAKEAFGIPGESETDVSEKLDFSSSEEFEIDDPLTQEGQVKPKSVEDFEIVDPLTHEGQVKARSGVVGRILEFKKKHQNAAAGSCTGCGTNFSAILKRRHVCNYCGNHFCARCCSYKVPKTLLGATAPGAQSDMVPVCTYCHGYLTGKKVT